MGLRGGGNREVKGKEMHIACSQGHEFHVAGVTWEVLERTVTHRLIEEARIQRTFNVDLFYILYNKSNNPNLAA